MAAVQKVLGANQLLLLLFIPVRKEGCKFFLCLLKHPLGRFGNKVWQSHCHQTSSHYQTLSHQFKRRWEKTPLASWSCFSEIVHWYCTNRKCHCNQFLTVLALRELPSTKWDSWLLTKDSFQPLCRKTPCNAIALFLKVESSTMILGLYGILTALVWYHASWLEQRAGRPYLEGKLYHHVSYSYRSVMLFSVPGKLLAH